jgi:hypothetical protein
MQRTISPPFGVLCHVGSLTKGMKTVLAPLASAYLGIYRAGLGTMFPAGGLYMRALKLRSTELIEDAISSITIIRKAALCCCSNFALTVLAPDVA